MLGTVQYFLRSVKAQLSWCVCRDISLLCRCRMLFFLLLWRKMLFVLLSFLPSFDSDSGERRYDTQPDFNHGSCGSAPKELWKFYFCSFSKEENVYVASEAGRRTPQWEAELWGRELKQTVSDRELYYKIWTQHYPKRGLFNWSTPKQQSALTRTRVWIIIQISVKQKPLFWRGK